MATAETIRQSYTHTWGCTALSLITAPSTSYLGIYVKMCLCVCACLCVLTCMWVCICMWKPAHVTCLPQLLSILHTEEVKLISSASLANQPAPWVLRLCLPLLGFQMDYRVQTAFTWVPGIRTLVFTFAQQALSTLSHFHSPEIFNFKLLHFYCGCVCVPWHTCGGQRTTGRSWLFSSIV